MPANSWLSRLKGRFFGAAAAPKTIELSFSRVQAFSRCPWMYHLIYDLGWRTGPNAPMALGMSLHRTLAAYLAKENPERTLERLCELYDQAWVNEGFTTTQETLDTYDTGRKMLANFFETDRARQSEVIATEKEFEMPLKGGIRFRGTVDRLDKMPDGAYEIVEYKTQGSHWTPSRIGTDLQMTLYDIGISKSLRLSPVRLRYYFLSTGESVAAQRTDEQRQAAERLLDEVAERVRREDYLPNHSYCGRCEFGRRCANFQAAAEPAARSLF